MKMKTATPCVAVLVLAFLMSGCNAVFTKNYLGEKPADLSDYDLNGTWILDDEDEQIAIVLKVIDPEGGILEAGWIETHGAEFELEHHRIHLNEQGDWLVGHCDDSEDPTRKFWFLTKVTPEKIIGLSPNLKTYKRLINTGEVKGVIEEGGNITLENVPAAQFKALVADESLKGFHWDEEMNMYRPQLYPR